MNKQKMYAVIKIGGFALSIAACILIALYIKNELNYDNTYPNADRIYRIISYFNNNDKVEKGADFPAPMAAVLKSDFPEVEKSGRLMPNPLFAGAGSNEVRRSDKMENSHEDGFTYADQPMLEMLQPAIVYGELKDALTEPNTMVITKSKADKFFPNQNPVGKIIYLNNDVTKPHKISAVIQNFPPTSHLQNDFLLSLAGVEFGKGEQTNWNQSNYNDYVLLKKGTDIRRFEKKITAVITKNYMLPALLKIGARDAEKELQKGSLHVQAVGDIHLKSYDIYDGLPHGDIRFVWLFGAVALFILVIACINFINLSTARSANRAKEVGLRKVVGSTRFGLINQFLTESLVFSLLSFILGTLLAWALLPYFNILADKTLTMPWMSWSFIFLMFLSATVVGAVAGIYPAFYLSGFKPAQVLKGSVSAGSKNSVLRNGLVVFQFATSIILIISTLVIYNQMQYILNKSVGFDKDQVLLIEGTNTLGGNIRTFKNELLKLPAVKSASISDYLPVSGTKRNGNSFYNEGNTKTETGTDTQFWQADDQYLQTLGIKLVAGRNFSYTMANDEQAVIINQTMAAKLNLKDPVGKRVTNGAAVFTVIGLMQDFNFQSLRDHVGALALHFGISPSIVSVKISGADMKGTISAITSTWKSFSPNQPVRYSFLDARFTNMYADVQRMGSIFTSFAILAIIVACLGLFALAAFMAEQRSKEIGIRKVLGASVSSITALLSVDFIKLVIIAIVIASPIAWWAMNKWLQDFSYRITITWGIFALAAMAAIGIAILTVSYQSIKAALMNPVKSLKAD